MMMDTMVQTWYRHGYDGHHDTGMAMMDTMIQAQL